jgi:hypothetical protein
MRKKKNSFQYFVVSNGKSVPVSKETYENVVLSMRKKELTVAA